MIIAISGLTYDARGNKGSAGSGKSTVTERIVTKYDFVNVALADVMKRFLQELFCFTAEQLWGPSDLRNAPDKRYVQCYASLAHMLSKESRLLYPDGLVAQYLSPRHALQTLGTEWARDMCWSDVWVAYAMRVANHVLSGVPLYDAQKGLSWPTERDISDRDYVPWGSRNKGVIFSDMRFKNEFAYVKEHGGKVVRVRRPVEALVVSSAHQSENDLNDVPDTDFDYVIHGQANDLDDLLRCTDTMMDWLITHGT